MPVMQSIPNDHPIMGWWEEYKQSDDYKNTKQWAVNPEHTDGSLWAAFLAGWLAAREELNV